MNNPKNPYHKEDSRPMIKYGKQRASFDSNSGQLPGFDRARFEEIRHSGDLKRANQYIVNYAAKAGTSPAVIARALGLRWGG